MKQTIYVDVLVIINIYINYGLLMLTSILGKIPCRRNKILIASLFGGVYSLIILLPYISDRLILLSRIPALGVMIFISFGFGSFKSYLRSIALFFAVNAVFAGVLFLLWFFAFPEGMYYNNGIVYFDINALTLVVLTVSAYLFIRLIYFFTKSKIPQSFIYNVKIFFNDKIYNCKGFYDSGNSLTDPFSGEGVTIVDKNIFKDLKYTNFLYGYENTNERIKVRLIPVSTVAGKTLLPSFRADRIEIEGTDKNFAVDRPIIALSDEKIHGGVYGVLLNSSVFDNAINGKGDVNV